MWLTVLNCERDLTPRACAFLNGQCLLEASAVSGTGKTSWLHRIDARCNSSGEYHNLLDDLKTREGFEDTSE